MNILSSRNLATLLLSVVLSAAAWAAPAGSSYSLEGLNFPVDFAASGPLTFNATGDLAPEVVPGTGGSVQVVEQFFAGAGPNGGNLLAFQFTFAALPAPGQFGFGILGLDIGMPSFSLLSAQLSIDFGVSQLPAADVLPLVIATSAGGANLVFVAPVGWSDVFFSTNPPAGAAPSQIVTTFIAEVAKVPEPSVLALVLIAGVGVAVSARRRPSA